MIVNLIRDADACSAEAPGVPAHRVTATPFDAAEREVRRRVLRSLADRENPPTAVVFVRTWEQADACQAVLDAGLRVVDDPVRPWQMSPSPALTQAAEALVRDGAPPPAEGRRGRRR